MEYERFEFQQPAAGTVNAVRIGDTLIDTGHMSQRASVEQAIREGDLTGIERVVLTHPHVDHFGGSVTVPELADLPHVVYDGTPAILNDVESYLREARQDMQRLSAGLPDSLLQQQKAFYDVFFPLEEPYSDVTIERTVSDGDTVRLGDYECEVVHTPGHSVQHMSLYHRESGTLFSGDIISENGHFMYAPLYWDVGAYKKSLSRLQTLDLNRLVPGHGPELSAPTERIADCIQKDRQTERKLRDGVRARGETTARELAEETLNAGETTLPFLTLVAAAYLHYLDTEGVCTVDVDADGVHASVCDQG
ncbi:Glyoxylase, beta-lactamase superfamily II [Halorientalis persicus]|uniref:Glyoxylase, beta-lactamase superfamily II n=1 Tax=Halorientalis persicus TaxID=1367881 RepID=A0A1H8MWI0_9EURY|nr:MBL fold metallo-hydrolase [Halorientalis persicus]SEO21745.1 Glyoxylase, beta-lactamase superfamily II [Halorientalis persicus]